MNENEAIEQMKAFSKKDPESAHMKADNLLCKVLIQLGWEKLVNEYYKIEKWD